MTITEKKNRRISKVKTILVSQKVPTRADSPYTKLMERYELKIDFRPFIQVERVSLAEFRRQKIAILNHSAVVFTSRNAVDHFFKICQELKIEMPAEMKYFCISEQTSYYLQKYIVLRKRKLFTGSKSTHDLMQVIKKHKNEKFLFPCSDVHKKDIPEFLDKHNIAYSKAIMYKTVASDLSDLTDVQYDIIVFFSPSGIESLKKNFPHFEQKKTRIAAFGPATAQAVRDAKLILDIEAPLPDAPSMTGALDIYIGRANGNK